MSLPIDIDKIINEESFDSMLKLFSRNTSYENAINRNFNDRKYYHIIWNLLHLISAEYPDEPTDQQKINLTLFIQNLNKFSCVSCRAYNLHVPNENEINTAVLSKADFIDFLINYHTQINLTARRYDIKPNTIVYTVDFIIQKYQDGEYKNYFKTIYDVDVELLIANSNLDLIYDKLIDIKKKIRTKKNIEMTFSHILN